MAADSPLTAAWADQARGSMLGSSDHHQKSSAHGHAAERGPAPQPAAVSSRFLAHVHHPRLPVVASPMLALVRRISPRMRGVARAQASGTRTTRTGTGERCRSL